LSGLVEQVIRASARRRPLVLAVAAGVALVGLICLLRLPVDALPDLSENQVLVLADWPGHSPREVERQVTLPLSTQLGGLEELKVVRTTSELGFSLVSLIFEDHADFHRTRAHVAERLASAGAGLPAGVVPTLAPEATALGQVFWYTLDGPGRDPGELRALQDEVVKPRLAAVHGVAEVASVGGAVREVQVEVDPLRLQAMGVSLEEVLAAAGRGSGASGGQALATATVEYVVQGLTAARAAADVGEAVVAARARGAVRVKDVSRVHLGPAPRRALLEKDGGEAVGGVVLMRHGENPRELIRRLRDRLEELQGSLPEGVRVVPFYDRTRLVDGALGTLRRVLLEEVVVCLLMVMLVLRHLRSALVVVLTLPVAVLASFALMAALDIPSNIMSLAGIAVAIGVLADSALVMTENAYTRLQEAGPDRPRDAVALEACLAVGRPLFFSVLITVVSFLPVFALSGTEGRLFWPLAVTKTFALLAVAVLAVTLVPALVPLLVRGRLRAEGEVWLVRSLQAVYRPVLSFLLERPWWVAASFALLAFTGVALAPRMGSEFMPALDEGVLLDMPVTAPGVTPDQAGRSLRARDAVLRSLPEVEVVVGKAGRAETATDPAPLEMLETVVGLRPRADWPARSLPARVFTEGARASLGPAAPGADQVGKVALGLFDRRMRAHLAMAPGGDLELLADAELRQALRDAAGGLGLEASPPAALTHPFLRPKTREELVQELDDLLQQPGWTNVWTQPIINRVEMLSTGIRTQVGVKVLGEDLEVLQAVASQVAQVLRAVPGAVDVFADQALGQPTVEVELDRKRAALAGVDPEAVDTAVDTALGGRVVGAAVEGRRRLPVRVRYAPDFRADLERVGAVLVGQPPVPLSRVATVRVVEGPGMIRGEHGLLAATVQLNVRGRDLGGFVEDAVRAVAAGVRLPEKVSLEWGGQYQHQLSARRTLQVVLPLVVALILLMLYLTWRDLGDALVLLLSVPGALVGGLVLQWLAGIPFSVAVWVGYIACFGLATETGIIVLTYMREAIERRGGLAAIGTEAELKEAVLAGAVQRLRPKLLTEGVIVLSLLPMAWATGVGAELLRPMAVPVLGGVLVADEVVDIAIPALFFWLRRARWRALRGTPELSGVGDPAIAFAGIVRTDDRADSASPG
jgi:Cu(I)/Ag(I) efflux system membrane protein CusA/SilA